MAAATITTESTRRAIFSEGTDWDTTEVYVFLKHFLSLNQSDAVFVKCFCIGIESTFFGDISQKDAARESTSTKEN